MSIGSDLGGLVGDLTNPYGSPSRGEWNLARGTFTKASNKTKIPDIIFFIETRAGQDSTQLAAVDTITDSGGRRLAVYEYPYRDGQAVSDLGRKGEKFTFNIKFFGTNYQLLFQKFLSVFLNSNESGKLSHPVRGIINSRFMEYEIVHKHDEWNAVTIRATFIEDNTDTLAAAKEVPASQNSALRSALQTLTSIQTTISSDISVISAALLIPNAIKAAFRLRLSSIVGQVSRLLGQLSATFSTDAHTQNLFATAASVNGNVTQVNSGQTSTQTLQPVFQVGFSPTDQANINANLSSFVSANQVSPQAAVFNANAARTAISAAIAEIQNAMGNNGFDILFNYRSLAVEIQQVTQSCISSAQANVVVYTTLSFVSLRQVAFLNGLNYNAQNQIESLNPYLQCLNYIPPGTQVLVPVA